MKLFFASDLHGSLPATEETIKLFLASGAKHLVLLGDTLNHGPRNPIPEGITRPKWRSFSTNTVSKSFPYVVTVTAK